MAFNLHWCDQKRTTMKKVILILMLCCSFGIIRAQSSATHALGIRLGGSDGAGAEISYQQFIGGNNRIEADLGFFDDGWKDGFKFTLLYQWVGNIDGGLNWYVGLGGSIGGWNVDEFNPGHDEESDGFFLDFDGDLGIEYNFPIPIQLSLDLRPEFGLINDDFDMGFGLGIRYTF